MSNNDKHCVICGEKLNHILGGPWSICFDPMWEKNCWGGDTHEIVGYICEGCITEMKIERVRK